MGALYNRSIDILRPTTRTNRAGETELDYTTYLPARTIRGLSVQMSTDDEQRDDAGPDVVTRWRVLSKPRSGDIDIRPTDHFRIAGGTILAVDGDVNHVHDIVRAGRIHHVEFGGVRAEAL